ncbi:MAG TPA: hypothetical protein GYA07_02950 [Verrucomicrobia bacterium]|nr:hypothetical protein [Verrucomicrobiota bacterium]HOB32207.1 hypothetical protein [Verrucomicrobiota bacterium]HOP97609.1 hypothetical protein [Verrucomicrobiota bacterium]
MKPRLTILARWIVRSLALTAAMGCVGPVAAASLGVQDFELITRRNIFDPNRVPPDPVRTPVRTPTRVVVDSFTLSGTMAYSKGFFAFFNGTSDEYEKVVEVGEKIAGFTVTDVGYDVVKLKQEDKEVELKVGMQMRRSSDGNWMPGQATSSAGATFASAARNAGAGWNRNDRRRGRNDDSGGFQRQRNWNDGDNRWGQMGDATAGWNLGSPQPGMPGQTDGALEAAVLDPSDPVARMMARRLQALGGGAEGQNPVAVGLVDAPDNAGNAPDTDGNRGDEDVEVDGGGEGNRPGRQIESGPLGRRADQGFQPTQFGEPGNEMNFEGNDNTNADNED